MSDVLIIDGEIFIKDGEVKEIDKSKEFTINYTNGQHNTIKATDLDENENFFIFYNNKEVVAMVNREYVFELLVK